MIVGPVLEIARLRKRLTAGNSVFLLDLPAFRLERGRFYGLVGRSGSGKSTLLDLIALVSRPTTVETFKLRVDTDGKPNVFDLSSYSEAVNGKKLVASQALTSRLRGLHFGYVLQTGGLFPFLSVRENIELPFRLSGRPFSPDRILDMARRLDIEDQLAKKPEALSGGQRQRASILRALATEPAILLADEPTAAIDEAMAEIVLRELRELASAQGTTVVLVSHDLDLVEKFADEIVTLLPRSDGNGHVTTTCSLGIVQ